MSDPSVLAVDLGLRPYGEVLTLQRSLCQARLAGGLNQDLLLLVEHPPVVTLGRSTRAASLPVAVDLLRGRGIEVYEVERGGDVTLHSPGQLVGYPILDLGGFRRDLHWYLRQIEEALIRGLAAMGVSAGRSAGRTGVWTSERKIASIGIHVKQWVSFHGFALNVDNDLSLFDLIVPCGIAGVRMTSVAAEAGRGGDPGLPADARAAVLAGFGAVFGRALSPATLGSLETGAGPAGLAQALR
jgi:lipoate-protein ligase B